jgi:hypothetical protein
MNVLYVTALMAFLPPLAILAISLSSVRHQVHKKLDRESLLSVLLGVYLISYWIIITLIERK